MNTQLAAKPRWATKSLYEDSDGPAARQFIQTFCRNQKASFGSVAGERIELRNWQAALIDDLLETAPDGSRRYRRGLIGLPKKNGKSLLGSALAIYFLVGDGEQGAEVYSCAAAKDQARVVFDEAKRMVNADPDLSSLLKVYRNAIEFPQTGSVYRVLSADADLQDGLNPSAVIFDEVHRQPNGELWAVMSQGIVTRPRGLLLGITTAGYDRRSLCYRLYDYGKRVSSGEQDDPSFYFRWWEPQDADANYLDPEVWQACNPGFDDFISADEVDSLSKSEPENDFRRFRLNQWTQTYSAWLKAGAWDTCASPDRKLQPNEKVVLGFDGSWSNDSTALVACSVEDFHLEVVESWERQPNEDPDEWRVPVEDVEDAIRAACERYKVLEVVCDPSYWKQTLQKLRHEGLPMVELANSVPRMVEATKAFEDAVYEKRLTHNGDPRLARHIANCVIKTDRRSDKHYITKEYKSSGEKIDLAIAAVMAFSRAAFNNQKNSTPAVFWLGESSDDDFDDWS